MLCAHALNAVNSHSFLLTLCVCHVASLVWDVPFLCVVLLFLPPGSFSDVYFYISPILMFSLVFFQDIFGVIGQHFLLAYFVQYFLTFDIHRPG